MESRIYYEADPCPNCGQEDDGQWGGARMGSSAWGHHYMCCSEKCGLEYADKLKRSKKPAKIASLQERIARLEADLKYGRL